MSNKNNAPKEIWISSELTEYFDSHGISHVRFSKIQFTPTDIKFISEQHHNEIVQQYEKKISDLLDRLVLKQDEVIAILKQQQNPRIECKICKGRGYYTESNDTIKSTHKCFKCGGSGYVISNND